MAHQAHNIPWKTVASHFQYRFADLNFDGITNLFPRFRPRQGNELNYFARAFAKNLEEHSTCERRKHAESYDPLEEEEIVLDDRVIARITPTMRRVLPLIGEVEDQLWSSDEEDGADQTLSDDSRDDWASDTDGVDGDASGAESTLR